MRRFLRDLQLVSGFLLLLWLLPGGAWSFFAASVTSVPEQSLWSHPAVVDWLKFGVPLLAVFAMAAIMSVLLRLRSGKKP